MVQSKAVTVDEYLAELPEERRQTIREARELVRRNLPKGYAEMMSFGMICYGIPLSKYSDTYNGQPLCYAAIAAQKNHNALYLMSAYADPEQEEALKAAFKKAGKKLDMGKSCLRFKSMDDIVPEAVAKMIASTPPEKYIERYEASRSGIKTVPKPAAKKPAAKKKPAGRG
jgi:uncharacterized protein YdhG (YjbR/CyaY superfamily)